MTSCQQGETGPHHWVIQPAEGGRWSTGECQNCHWIRNDFQNSFPDGKWADNATPTKSAAASASKRQERAEEERAKAANRPKRKHVKKAFNDA